MSQKERQKAEGRGQKIELRQKAEDRREKIELRQKIEGRRGKIEGGSMGDERLFHTRFWLKPVSFILALTLLQPFIFILDPDLSPVVAQTLPVALQRAFTLLGQKRVNDAIAAFQSFLRQNPNSLQAKLGLAISYRRAGRDADAWNAYQQVLAQDPNNQLALRTVGLLGGFRPEWQTRGIEALNRLLSLSPNDIEARAQRALLLGYQQRFAESLADYQVVLQNNPTPEAILGAAQVNTYSGNYQQALELFNRYSATGRQITSYAAIAYGRTLRETGNPAAAVQLLTGLLQGQRTLNDVAIQTRAELAQAYLANQQVNQALAVLEPLQARPDAVLPLARALNEIRRRTNNPAIAPQIANLYRQALSTTPNPSVSLLREAADVLSGLGTPQEAQTALQLYQQAAARAPNDRSIALKQLVLANRLGVISRNDFRARLLATIQPLPSDRNQLQQLARVLVDLDTPLPELLPVYQNILQAGINEPFLNFRIAQIFVQLNDLPRARQAIAAYAATPQGARDLAPQLLAAEIERREGNLAASRIRYEALINSNPSDGDVLNAALQGLAGVLLQQRLPDQALQVYDQLIARNPQDFALALGRASIAYQARRISVAEAEAVLNSWLTTQPLSNTPPELFSLVAALPPDPRKEPLYNALAQIDPNNTQIQLRLVQAIAQRSPAQARIRVQQILATAPRNVQTFFLQGELGQAIGDLGLASNAYQQILAFQPDNVDALAALGGVRFEQRRYNEAEQIYNTVLAFKPDDPGAQRALAGLSAIGDKPLTALDKLEQLQMQQLASGTTDVELNRQMQQIQEDFLQRRGFQPPWERFEGRSRNQL